MSESIRDRAVLAGTINGTVNALAMIVHELNSKNVISKDALATRFERAAQQAGRDRPPHDPRIDVLMLRNLAELLRMPTPPSGWTPTVIVGGLARREDDSSSD